MSNTLTRNLPERMLCLRYASIDETDHSIAATITTEAPTAVFDLRLGVIDEVLLAGGAVLPGRAPMLDSHDRSSVKKILGSVRSLQIEGNEVAGRLFFATDDPDGEKAWNLVRQGHLSDVSAGYQVNEYEMLYPREEKIIQGRQFRAADRKLRIATRWELKEVSLTPIGADKGAHVQRSNPHIQYQGEKFMSTYQSSQPFAGRQVLAHAIMMRGGLEVPERMAYEADRYRYFSIPEICHEVLLSEHIEPPEDWKSMIRSAISTGAVQEIFSTAVNAALYQSFESTEDPTAGWCREETVKNFHPQERAALNGVDQLAPVTRGGTADSANLDFSKVERYKIKRFGKEFVASEEDMADDNFGVIVAVPAALGAAARQLRADLVFSIIQENAALADGLAFFHNDRGNNFSYALDAGNLGLVSAAMGMQYRTGKDDSKICLNIRGKYLIVSETLRLPTAAIIRNLETANSNTNLVLRSDGRIDIGCRNPDSGVNYAGSTTSWYLASPDRPAIEVGYLGSRRPVIRQFKLSQGQWGLGWDIKFDIGAKAIYPLGIFRGNS